MNQDVALTSTGTPAILLGKERYPLAFTIAGMKEFAEHRGITFDEVLRDGWDVRSLSETDMRVLLGIAMKGAERRRVVFEGGEERRFPEEVIDRIVELAHPGELIALLVKVWNEPPVQKPDPPVAESTPPGA